MGKLALSRKKNEGIVIHRNGKVIAQLEVIDTRADRVRIAFDADKSVGIDRNEVYELKKSSGPMLDDPKPISDAKDNDSTG